jgi:hypothetical protein
MNILRRECFIDRNCSRVSRGVIFLVKFQTALLRVHVLVARNIFKHVSSLIYFGWNISESFVLA